MAARIPDIARRTTRLRGALLGGILVVTACGGGRTHGVVTSIPPRSGVDWLGESRPAMSETLRALVDEVQRLGVHEDRDHGQLVATLRVLARSVRELGASSAKHADRVEQLATLLERSGPAERHAPLAVDAMREALAAVHAGLGERTARETRDAYLLANAAVDEIALGEELLDQPARVQLALAATVDAIAAAQGAERPFRRVVSSPDTRRDLATFRTHVGRVTQAVQAVAAAQDWETARARTADALLRIADAVETSPMGPADVRVWAMAIRYEALRLRSADSLDHRRVDWAKAGLLAAARAVREMVPRQDAGMTTVAESARSAADAVDANATFAFQRVAIQDALRAVAGGLAMLGTAEPAPPRVTQ